MERRVGVADNGSLATKRSPPTATTDFDIEYAKLIAK